MSVELEVGLLLVLCPLLLAFVCLSSVCTLLIVLDLLMPRFRSAQFSTESILLLISGVSVTVLWVLLSLIGGHIVLGMWSFVAVVLIFGSVVQYFVLRQIFPEEF